MKTRIEFDCECGGKFKLIDYSELSKKSGVPEIIFSGNYGQWRCDKCNKKESGYTLFQKI
jgi:hypothetical protein